jgi:L-ascorbate metabolism protein UlaG (beta-lactamase superfamily)
VAGFKLDTSEGATLLIDPFLSRKEQAHPALAVELEDLFPTDEILLTNGRFDHAIDTPALVKETGAIVHAPEAVCRRLTRAGVSRHSLQPINFHQPKTLGSLRWQALPSLVNQADSSPVLRALTRSPQLLDQMSALDRQWPVEEIVAYFLETDDLSLVHFGSAAWLEPNVRDLKPDIALLPVERPVAAHSATIQLIELLKPRLVIPHHWDDYFPPLSQLIDLDPFKTAVAAAAPEVNVFFPTLGQSFDPADLL